jgi:chemotaxis protein CheX
MKEINSEISDAVGELTNMISGQARQEIEKMGKLFHGAIPTVVTGKNHKLISMVKGPKIAVSFKTDAGSFTIEVSMEG